MLRTESPWKWRLGNRQRAALADGGRGLPALIAIDDDQNFVQTRSRVAAHRAIVDVDLERSVAHYATQNLGDVSLLALHAVVGADDPNTIRVVAVKVLSVVIASIFIPCAIVPVAARRGNSEDSHVERTTFFEIEFALLASSVSREDAQSLVSAPGWITAHCLITYGDAAVHPAARNQLVNKIRDVVALVSVAVVRTHDQPTLILGIGLHRECRRTDRHEDHRENNFRQASGWFHNPTLPGERESSLQQFIAMGRARSGTERGRAESGYSVLALLALCQHILPVDVQPAPTGFFEDGVVRDAGKIKIRRNYSTALQVASGLN